MTASVRSLTAKKLAPVVVGCALALSLAPVGCASTTADSDDDNAKVAETVTQDEDASTDAAEGTVGPEQ